MLLMFLIPELLEVEANRTVNISFNSLSIQ